MGQPASAVAFEERGFLDRFPWYVLLLALLALVLIIGFALDYYLFKPSRDEAERKMTEVAELKRQNQDADIIRANIAEFEKTLEELNQRFDDLKVRLPEQREVSQIFENVRTLISQNGLQLLEYRSPSSTETNKNYYTEIPSAARVAGTYVKIQQLFQALSDYQRILNVTDINLRRAPDQLQAQRATTEAAFNITAFYISEENRKTIDSEIASQGAGAGADKKDKAKTDDAGAK